MDRRTMLLRTLGAGAVVVAGPVLRAGAADSASSGGSGLGATPVPLFNWERSLPVVSMSPAIGTFGGTELRALATMDGSLYAGNGYWRDSQQSNPALPGAQVYALDAPTASWGVDAEFSERVVPGGKRRYQAIGALYCARFAEAGQSVLLASVWDRVGSLTIFSKVGRSGSWDRYRFVQTAKPGAQTRSFGQHRDQITGEELVFAGTNPLGIFSGTYDPGKPGGIDWAPHPEAGVSPTQASQRVMSFAQCNGKLYATVGWQIYERQDGKTPSWKHVFTWGHNLPLNGNGGLRGLTSIPGPAGAGEVLLAAAEGRAGRVLRIAPPDQYSSVTDLNVLSFASRELNTTVEAVIVAYNNMTRYAGASPGGGLPGLLIGGYDAKLTSGGLGPIHKARGAYVLLRDSSGGYRGQEVVDPAITPRPALVATRTIIVSPFADDPPGTVYAGGFDAGSLTPHNSAWLYRGTPHAP
jgi:poly(A) polymerase